MITWLSCLALLMTSASGQTELFKNPDFELPYDGQNNWWCQNCNLDKSTDAYRGSYSGRVTSRQASWAGISQYVPVQPNRRYAYSLRVKILNQNQNKMWHYMKCTLHVTYMDGSVQYPMLGESPYVQQADGWTQMGGDFKMDGRSISQARFYIEASDADLNFLVDSASMTEVTPSPTWREDADLAIELIRKRDMQIRLNLDSSYNPEDVEIQVELLRHEFAFGSAVKADLISGSDGTSIRYQETFYDLFDWAVLENAHKWKQMEYTRGSINYERPKKAVDALRNRNITLRGHCVTWGVDERVPDWLKPLSGNEVRTEVTKRINGVVSRFRGRLEHWDVNNEVQHGTFFEQKTGDPWYTEQIFREVRGVDSDVKLFFNDFNIVTNGLSTHAYRHQIEHAQLNNVPVDGIGIQSHVVTGFDIPLIANRLDVLSALGLPIWVTELDYPDTDRNKRADAYEDLLRLYFSHPSIEGVLVWGFWDGAHWKPNAALAEGENVELNEAGLRYRQLVRDTWTTNEVLIPSSNTETLFLRGFHGNYRLTLNVRGNQVKVVMFTMPSGEGSFVINVAA